MTYHPNHTTPSHTETSNAYQFMMNDFSDFDDPFHPKYFRSYPSVATVLAALKQKNYKPLFKRINGMGLSNAFRVMMYSPRMRTPIKKAAIVFVVISMFTLAAQANRLTPISPTGKMSLGFYLENYPADPTQIELAKLDDPKLRGGNPILDEVDEAEGAEEYHDEDEFIKTSAFPSASFLLPADLKTMEKTPEALANVMGSGLSMNTALSSVKHPLYARTSLMHLNPTPNAYITSNFGWRWGRPHNGVDLAAPTGSPIFSSKAGRVVFSGWDSGYGRAVIIDHGNGEMTRYAHCGLVYARKGQWVDQGQIIARIGMTGRTTGPHLHYEVIVNGSPRNPLKFMDVASLPSNYDYSDSGMTAFMPMPKSMDRKLLETKTLDNGTDLKIQVDKAMIANNQSAESGRFENEDLHFKKLNIDTTAYDEYAGLSYDEEAARNRASSPSSSPSRSGAANTSPPVKMTVIQGQPAQQSYSFLDKPSVSPPKAAAAPPPMQRSAVAPPPKPAPKAPPKPAAKDDMGFEPMAPISLDGDGI